MVQIECVPSPQLMVAVKSLRGAFGLASVKVATVAARAAPSVPLKIVPAAVSGASATLAVPLSVVVLPPTSLIVTVGVYVPSSAYRCEPLTVKLPLLPATAALVKVVVVPSPQAIVPEKSLAVAPALASVNIALSVAAVTPSTPPVTVAVPAVSGASTIAALSLAFPVVLLESATTTPIVYDLSSA